MDPCTEGSTLFFPVSISVICKTRMFLSRQPATSFYVLITPLLTGPPLPGHSRDKRMNIHYPDYCLEERRDSWSKTGPTSSSSSQEDYQDNSRTVKESFNSFNFAISPGLMGNINTARVICKPNNCFEMLNIASILPPPRPARHCLCTK